jgi:hypothetical protein
MGLYDYHCVRGTDRLHLRMIYFGNTSIRNLPRPIGLMTVTTGCTPDITREPQ